MPTQDQMSKQAQMPEQDQTSNQDQWCFAWYQPGPGTEGQTRAALLRGAKWNPGDVITVSFLDGDAGVKDKVQAAAKEWTGPQMANLTLSFRKDTTDTMIRISFRYAGSWSTIGTTCRLVPKGQPTMNYGWLDPGTFTDEQLRQVVLHEFGHALGLIHEHQNPAGGIKWSREAVYRDLSGPPNNWSREVIDRNMFQPYSAKETNFTKLDPKSIMMYPIPARWTTDGTSVGLNSKLSDTDKNFIRKQYS
jgi:serralysin